jgi:hypothetical protein
LRGVFLDQHDVLGRPERRETEPLGRDGDTAQQRRVGSGADADREIADPHLRPASSALQ